MFFVRAANPLKKVTRVIRSLPANVTPVILKQNVSLETCDVYGAKAAPTSLFHVGVDHNTPFLRRLKAISGRSAESLLPRSIYNPTVAILALRSLRGFLLVVESQVCTRLQLEAVLMLGTDLQTSTSSLIIRALATSLLSWALAFKDWKAVLGVGFRV